MKLCRRFLHREPVSELCGADLYKFAELRSLGLLNEQIDWKQRFFVPTDEEKGIAVLDSLLARYPIIPSEVSAESETAAIGPQELSRSQTVNLDEWFLPLDEATLISPFAPDDEKSKPAVSTLPAFYAAETTVPAQGITQTQLSLNFG